MQEWVHIPLMLTKISLFFWFLQATAFENSNVRLVYPNARGTQTGKPRYAIVRQPSGSWYPSINSFKAQGTLCYGESFIGTVPTCEGSYHWVEQNILRLDSNWAELPAIHTRWKPCIFSLSYLPTDESTKQERRHYHFDLPCGDKKSRNTTRLCLKDCFDPRTCPRNNVWQEKNYPVVRQR